LQRIGWRESDPHRYKVCDRLLIQILKLIAECLKFSGESQHLFLQPMIVARVLWLCFEPFAQLVDLHGPVVLMGLFAVFGSLGSEQIARRRGFGGEHARLQFRDIGWE
jgi:hypothetical protein